jgi:hypothetical protein
MKHLFSGLIASLLLSQSAGVAEASWFSSEEPGSKPTEATKNSSDLWSGAGLKVGAFDYEINSTPGESSAYGSPHLDKALGYKIGLDYAIGYKSFFELRTRCSFGLGFSNFVDAVAQSVDIPSQTYLFDVDIGLLFPINVNKDVRLSLVPAIGFGMHQNYTKLTADVVDESTKGSFYRNRLLSPYCGLYLQLIPTDKLFLRTGFTVQFPYGSERFVSTYFSENVSRKTLGSRRHGTGAEFTVNYAITNNTCITASFDMLSLSVGGASSLFFHSRELSYMLGFFYKF